MIVIDFILKVVEIVVMLLVIYAFITEIIKPN